MDAIRHALSPEQLARARAFFETIPLERRDFALDFGRAEPPAEPDAPKTKDRAEALDRKMRDKHDSREEADDRNRFERRRSAALARTR